MTVMRIAAFAAFAALFGVLVSLVFWGAMIYIVAHFVVKFW